MGGGIISSRWKNWEAGQKVRAEAPRPRTATDRRVVADGSPIMKFTRIRISDRIRSGASITRTDWRVQSAHALGVGSREVNQMQFLMGLCGTQWELASNFQYHSCDDAGWNVEQYEIGRSRSWLCCLYFCKYEKRFGSTVYPKFG